MFLKCTVFASILILAVVDSTRAKKSSLEHMSLQEKAVHHYDQLVRTLTEIKKTGLGDLSAALRAGSGSLDIKNDDVSTLILRSLLTPCHTFQNVGEGSETNINIFNNATINFSSSRDKKKKSDKSPTKDQGNGDSSSSSADGQSPSSEFRHMTKSPEELSTWMENLVRPINFTLKREGQLVRVTFDVLRTGPAFASHSWTFDGERKNVKGPVDYGLDAGLPITSPIDFVFNASDCPPKRSHSPPRREHFSFSKKSNGQDAVLVVMPTCLLDVVNGVQENSEKEFEFNEPEDEYAQKLYYPNHLSQMNTSTIQTAPGENVTFDMQIAMGKEDHLIIEGLLYNATSDSTFISNNLFLQVSERKIRTDSYRPDAEQHGKDMLHVKVLNSTLINGSIPGTEYKALNDDDALYYMSATLRITVMTANEDVSGMLLLQHEFKIPLNSQESPSVRVISLHVSKSIDILGPNQTEGIPKGRYLTHTKKMFKCGDRGFSRYQGFGDNCTFFCSVFGSDLKNIRVRKINGGISPVQKYAEVYPERAILFANLGPTRKEIDGEYECRAIAVGGKRHKWTVRVATWGFPEVKETRLDIQNDSASFVCVVASERPVDIHTTLSKGEKSIRLEGDPKVTRVLHKSGNRTRVQVTLPTSYLRWPNDFLGCEVESEGGPDGMLEPLRVDNVPGYYYRTNHPFLLQDESLVTDHRDGVTTVKCVATGKEPLQINFLFNYISVEGDIVKNNSMNIITTEREGDKTTTNLKIPTASLKWPRQTLSCRAKNEYGQHSIHFELSDVIHQYY